MRNKSTLILLFFLLPRFLFCCELNSLFHGLVDFEFSDGQVVVTQAYYRFTGNQYSFFLASEELYEEKGQFLLKKNEGFNFISFDNSTNLIYKNNLGVLYHPRRLYLYEGNKLFFASDEGLRYSDNMPRVETIESSSFLTEGNEEYQGMNFINPYNEELKPWVEDQVGYGIGEWIEINIDSYQFPTRFFLISNGYVSFEKPYLYKYNSRVKRIRITCVDLCIDFEVELEDTPDFQEIKLPKEINERKAKFRFTILDVYPGTKWEDTCINLIIPLGELP